MENSLIIVSIVIGVLMFLLFNKLVNYLSNESKEQREMFIESIKIITGYSENQPISDEPLPFQEEQELVDLGDTDPNTLLNYLKKKKEYED